MGNLSNTIGANPLRDGWRELKIRVLLSYSPFTKDPVR